MRWIGSARRARGFFLIAAVFASLVSCERIADAGESAEVLFSSDGLTSASLSPSGDWIAATFHGRGKSIVSVQRVGHPTQKRLVESIRPARVVWDGPASLLILGAAPSGIRQILAVRLSFDGGEIGADQRHIALQHGELVDALPGVPERVVWAFQHRSTTSLHRVSIDQLVAYEALRRQALVSIDLGEKLAVERGAVTDWVVEDDGTPRAALRRERESTVLLMASRGGDSLRAVHRFRFDEAEREVRPVGLTPGDREVIVSAFAGRETLGLHTWDDEADRVGRPISVHPSYDLSDVLVDASTGDLVAAVYEEDGERRHQYLEAYRSQFLSKLPEAWRRPTIAVASSSTDRETFVLFEASSTNPGEFHVRERSGRITQLGRIGVELDRERLAESEAFRVQASDGVEIEAFLTLPRDVTRPVPLVVMPHGGPHRVRDSRRFDPAVQYLASFGIAVLQVNYRGSAGYGMAFDVLSKKQWARGIEDDIDAAVERVMSRSDVDGTRICIVGGSYGGFSALVGLVRHPERVRCGVTINGVTDVPLLSDSSDMADSKRAMRFFEEYVGDVESEREALLEISPAYHVREISAPVLVVYGTKDRRVDPDHAHRLLLMLELHDKPHESLEVAGAAHGFDSFESIAVWRAVRRFLSRHLLPDRPYEEDPQPSL